MMISPCSLSGYRETRKCRVVGPEDFIETENILTVKVQTLETPSINVIEASPHRKLHCISDNTFSLYNNSTFLIHL